MDLKDTVLCFRKENLENLKEIQTFLSKSCDEECLISLTLKCLVNRALEKLPKINPLSNVTFENEWEDLSEQSDCFYENL